MNERLDKFYHKVATMKTFLSLYTSSKQYTHYCRYIDAVRGLQYYCSKNSIDFKFPIAGYRPKRTISINTELEEQTCTISLTIP